MHYCKSLMVMLLATTLASADDKPDATRDHAQAFWNANVRKQQGTPQEFSTDNVFVLGSVDVKALESIAKAAERAVVFAKKSVGYDKKPEPRPNQQMSDRPYQWEGKLILFVCKERQEFIDLFAKLKGNRPDNSEHNLFVHDKERTYLVFGPYAALPQRPPWEVEAVQLAGAATLTRRHDPLPFWFAASFGRMLARKYDPKRYAFDRQRAVAWSTTHHLQEIMQDDPLTATEALLPLQTALVECLSQSSRYQDQWVKLLDEIAYRGSVPAALKEMKLSTETLELEWKNWLAKK
jgi:hypothetical protein